MNSKLRLIGWCHAGCQVVLGFPEVLLECRLRN